MGTRSLAWGASLICRSFSLGLSASQESPKLGFQRFMSLATSATRAKEKVVWSLTEQCADVHLMSLFIALRHNPTFQRILCPQVQNLAVSNALQNKRRAALVAQLVKNLPAVWETWV